jgi:hypothetical protein
MNVKLPATYDAAKQAITKLERIDECAKWADTAAALRAYAYQMKDRTLEVKAIRIRDRAVRQGGLLLEKEKGKSGRRKNEGPRGPSIKESAKKAGISPRQAKEMSRVARVNGVSFERQVESANPPSVKELARQGTKSRPKEKRWLGYAEDGLPGYGPSALAHVRATPARWRGCRPKGMRYWRATTLRPVGSRRPSVFGALRSAKQAALMYAQWWASWFHML